MVSSGKVLPRKTPYALNSVKWHSVAKKDKKKML